MNPAEPTRQLTDNSNNTFSMEVARSLVTNPQLIPSVSSSFSTLHFEPTEEHDEMLAYLSDIYNPPDSNPYLSKQKLQEIKSSKSKGPSTSVVSQKPQQRQDPALALNKNLAQRPTQIGAEVLRYRIENSKERMTPKQNSILPQGAKGWRDHMNALIEKTALNQKRSSDLVLKQPLGNIGLAPGKRLYADEGQQSEEKLLKKMKTETHKDSKDRKVLHLTYEVEYKNNQEQPRVPLGHLEQNKYENGRTLVHEKQKDGYKENERGNLLNLASKVQNSMSRQSLRHPIPTQNQDARSTMNLMNMESFGKLKDTVVAMRDHVGEQEKMNQDLEIKKEEPLNGNTNQDRVRKMREDSINKNKGSIVNKEMRGSDKETINEKIEEEYKCLNCHKLMTFQDRMGEGFEVCLKCIKDLAIEPKLEYILNQDHFVKYNREEDSKRKRAEGFKPNRELHSKSELAQRNNLAHENKFKIEKEALENSIDNKINLAQLSIENKMQSILPLLVPLIEKSGKLELLNNSRKSPEHDAIEKFRYEVFRNTSVYLLNDEVVSILQKNLFDMKRALASCTMANPEFVVLAKRFSKRTGSAVVKDI